MAKSDKKKCNSTGGVHLSEMPDRRLTELKRVLGETMDLEFAEYLMTNPKAAESMILDAIRKPEYRLLHGLYSKPVDQLSQMISINDNSRIGLDDENLAHYDTVEALGRAKRLPPHVAMVLSPTDWDPSDNTRVRRLAEHRRAFGVLLGNATAALGAETGTRAYLQDPHDLQGSGTPHAGRSYKTEWRMLNLVVQQKASVDSMIADRGALPGLEVVACMAQHPAWLASLKNTGVRLLIGGIEYVSPGNDKRYVPCISLNEGTTGGSIVGIDIAVGWASADEMHDNVIIPTFA